MKKILKSPSLFQYYSYNNSLLPENSQVTIELYNNQLLK